MGWQPELLRGKQVPLELETCDHSEGQDSHLAEGL